MALFGKKKDSDNPATPDSATAGSKETSFASKDEAAFDFDAIARDLDAQDGASAFDRLLSQPVDSGNDSSADSNTLDLDQAFLSDLETVAPFSKRPAPAPEPVTPPIEAAPAPVIAPTPAAAIAQPVPEAPARKKSPIPIALAVVAGLALLGSGAYFGVSQLMTPAPDESAPVVLPPRPAAQPDKAAPVPPPAAPKAPVAAAPTAPKLAQLKQLWEQGKAAKANGDYVSARRYWQQALQIEPGHPGFQESIDKLPK